MAEPIPEELELSRQSLVRVANEAMSSEDVDLLTMRRRVEEVWAKELEEYFGRPVDVGFRWDGGICTATHRAPSPPPNLIELNVVLSDG